MILFPYSPQGNIGQLNFIDLSYCVNVNVSLVNAQYVPEECMLNAAEKHHQSRSE